MSSTKTALPAVNLVHQNNSPLLTAAAFEGTNRLDSVTHPMCPGVMTHEPQTLIEAVRYFADPDVTPLLPHSAEPFLLHLGLTMKGRIPAVLPWPAGGLHT
jgi:hypothetical protein